MPVEVKVQFPQIKRDWAVCPHCGAKVTIYDNTAECKGVFMKCTRNPMCKKEFELVIKNGRQILKK